MTQCLCDKFIFIFSKITINKILQLHHKHQRIRWFILCSRKYLDIVRKISW